jgi:hypothetical protein
MNQRLTRRTVEHAKATKVYLLDAYRDRCLDADEFYLLVAHIDDTLAVGTAAHVAGALGDALERGIGDEGYRAQLMDQCWVAFDELPKSVA